MNGPVFRSDDRAYRGVKLPREFWKVVAYRTDAGEPGAVAFVLTQAELIAGLEEEFEVGEYQAVQVKVSDLASRTKLDFGPLDGWDPLEQEGAKERFSGDSEAVVLGSVADVVLG